MTISAKERKDDYHAGPGDSFPVAPNGGHLKAAWDLAGHAAHPDLIRHHLIEFAREHNLLSELPDTAKEGVMKAEVISQEFEIKKSWDANGVCYAEGWIATNDRDRTKEITEPECFKNSLDSYFARGAPMTSRHDTNPYPIGHVQKAALVRDGQIFKEAVHPTDPANFEYFPSSGTGVYGRVAINDPRASDQVRKGNVRSFSYFGVAKSVEPLPGGGRRYLEINPLIECCIAAFPINPSAVMTVAKAQQEEEMTKEEIEALIAQAVAAAQAPQQVQKAEPAPGLTVEQLSAVLTKNNEDVMKAFDDKLTERLAAQGVFSREGTGRLGQTPTQETELEADPFGYLVKKAQSDAPFTPEEGDLVYRLTYAALTEGMKD
jgi:hypothetical protein